MSRPTQRSAAAAVLCLLTLALALPSAAQDPAAKASLAGDPLLVPLPEAVADPTEAAAQAAAAVKAKPGVRVGPRTVSVVSTNKAGQLAGPISQPRHFNRRVKLGSLPKMRALTKSQMERQYTGASAPAAFHRARAGDSIQTMANGVAGASFSDSRFSPEYYTLGQQRVGKMWMRYTFEDETNWYYCSASVINRALLLTAAHCLCFQELGVGEACLPDVVNGTLQVGFELGVSEPQPPFSSGWSPSWTVAGIAVPTPYLQQTDTSFPGGFPSNNDLALVWLNPKDGVEVGDVAGWFSYGTNGYSFSRPVASFGFPTAPASAQMTAIGYPFEFDEGSVQQISHSAVYNMVISAGRPTGGKPPPPGMGPSPNTALKMMIRGSAYTGGSSGSPWIVNYGIDANVTEDGVGYGQNAERNVVMGVTSWGAVDPAVLIDGASFFGVNKEYPGTYGSRGSGNIAALMYDACDNPEFEDWMLAARDPPLCE